MSPYRTPPLPPSPPPEAAETGDLLIYALLVVLGAIRVAIAVVGGQVFGAEATVALILVGLGAVGLLRACHLRNSTRRRRGPAGGRTSGRSPRSGWPRSRGC